MDITHDNVCSSMLSCFYSHLLSTGRPISSFCYIPKKISKSKRISQKFFSKIYPILKIFSKGNYYFQRNLLQKSVFMNKNVGV